MEMGEVSAKLTEGVRLVRMQLERGYLLNPINAGDQTNHNVTLSIVARL